MPSKTSLAGGDNKNVNASKRKIRLTGWYKAYRGPLQIRVSLHNIYYRNKNMDPEKGFCVSVTTKNYILNYK